MSRHKLKQKKRAAGKQWWADICVENIVRKNVVRKRVGASKYVPVSHHAQDRTGFCGRCGHPWDWHDNVWLKVDEQGKTVEVKIRCRGGYLTGLTVASCQCREEYPG